MERAFARIDLGAVRANCERLRDELGGARLCAVVKADGYGHGAVACAQAALAGGASALAVATAAEAAELAATGVAVGVPLGDGGSVPAAGSASGVGAGSGGRPELITLGALTDSEVDVVLGAGSAVSVWTEGFRALVAARARASGRPARVHVKYDSGMGRLGTFDGDEVLALARATAADPDLELAGVWTHFATADEPDDDEGYFFEQLDRFEPVAAAVRAEFPEVTAHAANSAAVFRSARSHFDMARCGVAIYGLDPFQDDPRSRGLGPVLSWHSYVASVKRFPAGQSAGYGRRWKAAADTWVGVVPLGYGDGVRRALTNHCDVLVAGRRYPLVGTVSMDNLTIDLGPETDVDARGGGGADRAPGRRGDPRRGDRRAPADDQLRDHLRDLSARPAGYGGRMSLADELRAAELPQAAIRALGGEEGVWIAGGAVRDAALGRPVIDLDLAVAGDPGRVARALARELGEPAFELSAEFGTWRVVSASRGWQVDITVLRGDSIEADLALRDFTVGAAAVPLAAGEALDPYDGLADLERGVLRAVGPSSFTDDPLRLLRAARLAADLDLRIDADTVALAHDAAARAAEPGG